jgi:hypothetical protein
MAHMVRLAMPGPIVRHYNLHFYVLYTLLGIINTSR